MSEPAILFDGKPSLSLTGFMFSGKSSVGRSLARRLGLRYVDLDTEIVAQAGKSIERIFREDGETAFRTLEREVVATVLPVPGRVVAAGGGAIIDPENRRLMGEHSCVVWLKASPESVVARLRSSRGRVRPLLQVADPEAEVRRLLEARREYYEQCDVTMETDGLGVQAVVRRIIERFGLEPRVPWRPRRRKAAHPRPDAEKRQGGC